MNTDPADAVPPFQPARSRRRWIWLCAMLVLLGALLPVFWQRPFPTDEERKYIGWWRGMKQLDENSSHGWVAEFRPDGRVQVHFCRYERANPSASWRLTSSEEAGTWRVFDGVQELKTDDPSKPVGLLERINRIEQTGHWRRVHCYRTSEINGRELHYTAVFGGEAFRALRSDYPVTLPDTPLPPELWGKR